MEYQLKKVRHLSNWSSGRRRKRKRNISNIAINNAGKFLETKKDSHPRVLRAGGGPAALNEATRVGHRVSLTRSSLKEILKDVFLAEARWFRGKRCVPGRQVNNERG